jgi:putative tryptophan/tyrosine transport system substrate-binding protein
MRRREFITLLGGVASWASTARAQQGAMSIVGFLSSRSPGDSSEVVAAFRSCRGSEYRNRVSLG